MKMYRLPEHQHDLSRRLSKVLSNLGVNQCVVQRKRKKALLLEKLTNIKCLVYSHRTTTFVFGSQIEASTTPGLSSDRDFLSTTDGPEVIQTMRDWRQGRIQYLMVQNEFTSAGYCLLQKLKSDMPEPAKGIEDEYHSMNKAGDLFFKHYGYLTMRSALEHSVHGPALALPTLTEMEDSVLALDCRTWPREAEAWLKINNADGWPTEDMKRFARNHGCFLVPVSSKTSAYPDLEWRISTSHAERYLMISLNITQLRCYILMKMIIKDFVKPRVGDVISSFMCKCVLLHCISQSAFRDWQNHTLVSCLLKCLQVLFKNIRSGNCPHFVIPRNNLFAGKLSTDIKQQLETILIGLTDNIEQTLLRISTDDLGYWLYNESNEHGISAPDAIIKRRKRICWETFSCIGFSSSFFNVFRGHNAVTIHGPKQLLQQMLQLFLNGGVIDQLAYRLTSPFLCVMIGSSLASADIQHSRPLSPEIIEWFKLGLCSDVASSKLKVASVLYCVRDFGRCENILSRLCRLFKKTTALNFSLFRREFKYLKTEQCPFVYWKDEVQAIKDHAVFCTVFQRIERNCAPKELWYEMFRSTQEDLAYRKIYNFWMDSMVVDSLAYLYFLQYKVYQQRRKLTEKLAALTSLIQTIDNEPDLFHKETALNLLGQCMEQENRRDLALKCYVRSLIVCPSNNAAKWHISLLLFSAFKSHQGLKII